VIQEGPIVAINQVDFDGIVQLESKAVRSAFYDRALESVKKRVFVATDLSRSAELLVDWMKSQGFLSAELLSVTSSPIANGSQMKVLMHFREGERTLVDSVKLNGFISVQRPRVLGLLGLKEGQPLDLGEMTIGLERLKMEYRNQGYLDFQIVNEGSPDLVGYFDENRRSIIQISADEGPRFIVSKIEVEGLVKTKRQAVLHEVPFREKQLLTEQLLNEAESNLKRLGIFSQVEIQIYTDPERIDAKVVRIRVVEGTPGVWGVGGGVRNDLGLRGFGSIGYTNLFGRNHAIQLSGAVNRRFDQNFCKSAPCFVEYQFQLTYNVPHLGLQGLALRPRTTVENIRYFGLDSTGQNNGFDAFVISAGITLEKRFIAKKVKIFSKPVFAMALDYSLERIAQSNARLETDNRTLRIGSLTPSARFDWRDSPLSPRKGIFSQISFEWASKYLGSQVEPSPVGYTRFQFRADGHIPLGKIGSWYLSFRTGLARNLEPPPAALENTSTDYAIPISKLFVLGGVGSIRGLPERALFTDYAIRGTLSYVNYRTQIDLPLMGDLRIGPFLDAGGLHVDSFSFGSLRWGAGVGLRYMSPVGPINFDVGFNLFPQGSESGQQVYFSIGVI
jgi:outer membrane protein assembly factor BamA